MKNSPELLALRALTYDDLWCLYHLEGLSHAQIAERFSVSRCAVQNVLKHHGIVSRTNAESQTAINQQRFRGFTYGQEQLVYGSLLGDANLHYQTFPSNKTGMPMECYKLTFAHTSKHLAYLNHKKELLGLGVKCDGLKTGTRISGHGSVIRHFSFCHTPTLRKVAELCHDGNHQKRITKAWLDKLDWPGLAYWYQDDGSIAINQDTGQRSIVFYTNSFSLPEQELLQEMLGKVELHTIIGPSPNGTTGEYRPQGTPPSRSEPFPKHDCTPCGALHAVQAPHQRHLRRKEIQCQA